MDKPSTVYVCIGHDPNGIRRCWGTSDISLTEAEEQCVAGMIEYVRGRPDTGPLDKWTIKHEVGGHA
jgi:hypothetical protein